MFGRFFRKKAEKEIYNPYGGDMDEILKNGRSYSRTIKDNDEIRDYESWKEDPIIREMMVKSETEYMKAFGEHSEEDCWKGLWNWERYHFAKRHGSARTIDELIGKTEAGEAEIDYIFIDTMCGPVGTGFCSTCRMRALEDCGEDFDRYHQYLSDVDAEHSFYLYKPHYDITEEEP